MKLTKEQNKLTSDEQRAYYFSVIVKMAIEYYEKHPESLSEDFTFLIDNIDGVTSKGFVHNLFKLMFRNILNSVGKQTKVEKMNDFIFAIRDRFMHRKKNPLFIPSANEPPMEER